MSALPADLGAAVAASAERLRRAGIDNARHEARLLAALASGVGYATVLGRPETPLPPDVAARLAALTRRRAAGEPYSRIAGRREFWSLSFALGAATLDPRPDSETVVEAVLAGLPDRRRPLRLLDLGTGSGCILLALLHELPGGFGIGVDVSADACRVARHNAAALGLARRAAFVAGDWAAALDGRFDVIVANPPYVAADEIARLPPEVVRHDPLRALAGGPDGLDAYRRIAPALPGLLAPGGRAAVEIGAGQADAVARLLSAAGLAVSAMRADLHGVTRCIVAEGRKNGTPAQKRVFIRRRTD